MMKSTLRLWVSLSLGASLLVATAACTQPAGDNSPDREHTSPEAVVTPDGDPDTPRPGDAQTTERALALSGEGIQFVEPDTGSTRLFIFGTELTPAQNAVSQVLGAPESVSQNDECPGTPFTTVLWPNGLALNADGDTFVGWSVRPGTDSASLTTLAGIGIGSTRRDLEAAYDVEVFGSTLGVEFYAGQLAGLLSGDEPDAQITDLWAGVVCIFR